jgi:HPt (histidine-containing phosphotransfer) domain-containing protein
MDAQNLNSDVVLDAQQALERIGDDREIYEAVAGAFLSDTPLLLASLQQALEQGDRNVATRMAHSLKSSAWTVGAMKLGASAAALEALLMDTAVAVSQPVLQLRIEQDVPAALAALTHYLQE